MGPSEDPSLVNNVDDLGLVYYGLRERLFVLTVLITLFIKYQTTLLHYVLLSSAMIFPSDQAHVRVLNAKRPLSGFTRILQGSASFSALLCQAENDDLFGDCVPAKHNISD